MEREGDCTSLDNAFVIFAIGAVLVLVRKRAKQPCAFVLPEAGERFSLSPGERAGVRASV